MVETTPRARVYHRTKQQMEDYLRQMQREGRRRLDSEKRMSERFQASRLVVRQVLADLRQAGRVESVAGKGHFLRVDGAPSLATTRRARDTQEQGVVSVIFGGYKTVRRGITRGIHADRVLGAVERVMEDSPHQLVVESVGPQRRSVLELIRPQLANLCGVMLVPVANQSPAQMLAAVPDEIPTVAMGRPSPRDGVPCVYIDHVSAGRQAARLLLNYGHRRIGLLGRMAESWMDTKRLEGFEAEMADASVEVDPALIGSLRDGSVQDIEPMVRSFLQEKAHRMTALLIHAGIAPLVASLLGEMGIEVPGDLSLVSLDDHEQAHFVRPRLTMVTHPSERIGEEGGHMMKDLLAGRQPAASSLLLPTDVVVRDSTSALNHDTMTAFSA